MTDGKFLVGQDILPINQFMEVRLFSDGFHQRYSLAFQGVESLLFDTMHVDALFHKPEDPLSAYYPSLADIVSDINGDSKSFSSAISGNNENFLGETIESLNQLTETYLLLEKGLAKYASGLKSYDLAAVIKETGVFEKVAEVYRDMTFAEQIPNLETAKTATEKQMRLLEEIGRLGHKIKDETKSDYKNLAQVLTERINILNSISKNYDDCVKAIYDGNLPFPKYGFKPKVKDKNPFRSMIFTTTFLSRPGTRHIVNSEIKECYRGIEQIAEQVRMHASAAGSYSTRPDLR